MANRWADGCGRYGGDTAKMLNGSSGQAWAQMDDFSLSTTHARTGTHCLRMGAATRPTARRVFGAPLQEVFIGYAMRCAALPTNETDSGLISNATAGGVVICQFRNQSNVQRLGVWLGTDGALEARVGSTVLDRSLPVVGTGAYNHFEYYTKAGTGTSGALEVRVNEQTALNLTNVDTGDTEFSQFAIGAGSLAYQGDQDFRFADFYCNDTVADGSGLDTFVGDVKSEWDPYVGDDALAEFLKSAGSTGHSLLGIPINDGTYVSDATGAARSAFQKALLGGNVSEILTARPAGRVWKTDAGSALFAPTMRSNGLFAPVPSQPITTAPAYHDSNVAIDPNTGAPWTPAGYAAAFGVLERVAA